MDDLHKNFNILKERLSMALELYRDGYLNQGQFYAECIVSIDNWFARHISDQLGSI
ncbi:MAG: hypothetical protein MN733_24525 [Nitrososphaera sp.]|nr:hypothetical protein [Nitrososphaera sp.]